MFSATVPAARGAQSCQRENFTWQEDEGLTRRRQRQARLRHLLMAVLLVLVCGSGLLISRSLCAGSVDIRGSGRQQMDASPLKPPPACVSVDA